MKIPQCEKEEQVIDALQSGRWGGPWGEEIRKHAARCAACSEVVLVATALRREDEYAQAEVRLPSAGLVWWKAQRAARRAAEERAAQPIAMAERIAELAGILTAFGLALWQWPRIAGWVGETKEVTRVPASSMAEWSRHLFQTLAQGLGQSPVYLVLASLGTFLTLVALAAYAVWREE
jgi:hypothetical protein